MDTVRLAYLVSRYPAISHTFILREVQTLRQHGFDIHIASINPPDRPPAAMTAEEIAESANCFYVKPAGVTGAFTAHWHTLRHRPLSYVKGLWYSVRLGGLDVKRILYNFFYFVEAVMIGHWMQQRQLTHLHVHFATQGATVALITTHIFPVHYSITVHGPDEFYNTHEFMLTEKIHHAQFICCISYFAQSQLMALSPPSCWDKFEISPLGVDPARFSPRPPRPTPTPFHILCVGRLVPVKGQAMLLAAVTHLVHAGRQVRLCYVGDGPDRDGLMQSVQQEELAEVVEFAGAVNQDAILDFYRQADVFVLASFAEGVPVVLMEAMAMEVPCVTTHITGIPELIEPGQGLLVPPSDVDKLAAAIARLMDEPALRQSIAKQGRAKVLQHYELQRNTLRLGDIFRRRLT